MQKPESPKKTRLTITSPPFHVDGEIVVEVKCDCGKEFTALRRNVLSGNTRSCGCLRRDNFYKIITKHGLSRHPLYNRWCLMIKRCEDPKCDQYSDYGGRGIKVCDKWRHSFPDYLKDVGELPFEGAEVDRIDNNRGYEPGNVKWSTDLEQNNNSRKCRKITLNGETLSFTQWARKLEYCNASLQYRLENMPLEEALQPNCGFKKWKQRKAIRANAKQR